MEHSILEKLLDVSIKNSENLAALTEKVSGLSEKVEDNSNQNTENFKTINQKLDNVKEQHDENAKRIADLERLLSDKNKSSEKVSKVLSFVGQNWRPIVIALIISLALFGFKVDPAIINTVIPGISRIVDSTSN